MSKFRVLLEIDFKEQEVDRTEVSELIYEAVSEDNILSWRQLIENVDIDIKDTSVNIIRNEEV